MRTVLYDVTDDNIAEPDEILTLSIVRSLASNQIPVEYVVQRVNVIIVDNDSECGSTAHICLTVSIMCITATVATIWFENISVSVQEGTGVAVLYVAVLDGALDRDVTVQFSTVDLSATGEPCMLCWDDKH